LVIIYYIFLIKKHTTYIHKFHEKKTCEKRLVLAQFQVQFKSYLIFQFTLL
jgi:hypothetical protein